MAAILQIMPWACWLVWRRQVCLQIKPQRHWPIASHQPATRNQTIVPINPNGPVPRSPRPCSSFRFTASWPKGQSEKRPITKHDRAQGSPTMLTAQINPASHQPRAITRPPSTTHKMLSRELIMPLSRWRRSASSWPGLSCSDSTGDHGFSTFIRPNL